jgi:hypothetical protein
MLRLFRNLLCLATVLHFGTAVQAQQQSAKAAAPKTEPLSAQKPGSVASTKAAKPDPVSVTKASKAEPVTTKSVKPPDSATAAKAAKPDSATSVRAAKPDSAISVKAAKPDSAISVKAAKPDSATSVKAAKRDVSSKTKVTVKAGEKVVPAKHNPEPRVGLVPPPPPDTPTMFAGDGIFPGFGMPDFNNPAVLAGRRKDIASQLASAKKLLADKEQRTKELKDKATQFEQLFSEGVISRRELESAQKDAVSAAAELNDARTQTVAYQNAMSRLDDRMKSKSTASKKSVKGKNKLSAKSGAKVSSAAGNVDASKSASKNPTSPVPAAAAPASADGAAKPTAQADMKAAPGP